MKIPYQIPDPSGHERAKAASDFRHLAHEIARIRPQALTRANGEEYDFSERYASNFTKGLSHDQNGLLRNTEDYRSFVEALNSKDRTLFEKYVITALNDAELRGDLPNLFNCKPIRNGNVVETQWRGWESPRSGHVYELEGPDPGAVGMAPHPRIRTEEMIAEMAEVYALAILRDVRFIDWNAGHRNETINPLIQSELSVIETLTALNESKYLNKNIEYGPSTSFERNRREARFGMGDDVLDFQSMFRGSTPGSKVGPYISQFMLIGNALPTGEGEEIGLIKYGTQTIDQKVVVHKEGLDYLTDWSSWLDVQNGANFKGVDEYEVDRRFISTPRDLATYVHFDALYQAYLNACLILLNKRDNNGNPLKTSKGFPEPSASKIRDAFATFGGPHILSLVTEVATRCLKSVRRQKFNYHRRCRPEAIGGRLTLANLGLGHQMGDAASLAFTSLLDGIPDRLLEAIVDLNRNQNSLNRNLDIVVSIPDGIAMGVFDDNNLLLPMAFPEGSPMHPAYGAGHATVAGGCVTMLKAFFEMFDGNGDEVILNMDAVTNDAGVSEEVAFYRPNNDGSEILPQLIGEGNKALTIQGELDKLAANISIGRNMAGVHYYSDYYDSLRLGERIAVGILMEQAPTYGDEMEVTFTSFDGDHITISGEAGTCPALSVMDKSGNRVASDDWWLRHASGEEIIMDN